MKFLEKELPLRFLLLLQPRRLPGLPLVYANAAPNRDASRKRHHSNLTLKLKAPEKQRLLRPHSRRIRLRPLRRKPQKPGNRAKSIVPASMATANRPAPPPTVAHRHHHQEP